MTTLAIMKARIASELRRSDLTTQIADAINTAIGAYEHERWYVNETRENTFTTVAEQPNYGVSDAAFIGVLSKIDYIFLTVGNQPFELLPETMKFIEDSGTNNTFLGQPGWYAFYDEQIWLYPVPNDPWTVRVGGVIEQAAPVSDAEIGNFWMIKGERLTRSRAKYEIQLHVLKNAQAAMEMATAVTEAYDQLNVRTTRKTKTGPGRVRAMKF